MTNLCYNCKEDEDECTDEHVCREKIAYKNLMLVLRKYVRAENMQEVDMALYEWGQATQELGHWNGV